MIQIEGLTKSFGHTYALREVDLQVSDGEFLTILGPNGAGKTTLLRVLATLVKPTSGLIRVNGIRLDATDPEIRRHIGLVTDRPLLYNHLTVEENLRFFGLLYEIPSLEQRLDSLLDWVGLSSRRHSPASSLSRGLQQRLSLARSILHKPSILLLDEPYTGLDQQAIQMLRELLRTLRGESHTVMMATHQLGQGLELCDRLVILSDGRVTFEAKKAGLTLSELREAYWQHSDQRTQRRAT